MFKNLQGERFEKWLVLERSGVNKSGNIVWKCKCDCGTISDVAGCELIANRSKSCGCLRKEVLKTHGNTINYKRSSEYETWQSLRQRCSNNHKKEFENYGGRGIVVCERWLNSFENFLTDMGPKPSPQHSIDRINNNLGYSPNNCRWATTVEQSHNKRIQKSNKSGTNGINWCKNMHKWQARISINKKRINLGYFDSINEAVAARKQAEEKYWEKVS